MFFFRNKKLFCTRCGKRKKDSKLKIMNGLPVCDKCISPDEYINWITRGLRGRMFFNDDKIKCDRCGCTKEVWLMVFNKKIICMRCMTTDELRQCAQRQLEELKNKAGGTL